MDTSAGVKVSNITGTREMVAFTDLVESATLVPIISTVDACWMALGAVYIAELPDMERFWPAGLVVQVIRASEVPVTVALNICV